MPPLLALTERGKVGGWWSKTLKECAQFREEYKSVGRNYDAERAFRARFAANTAKEMSSKIECRENRSNERLHYCRVHSFTTVILKNVHPSLHQHHPPACPYLGWG